SRVDGVASCAVALRGSGDEAALVAYVVPRLRGALDPARLREVLSSKLPAPFVPSTFAALSSLPTNPTGKLDRRALPALAPPRTTLRDGRGDGGPLRRRDPEGEPAGAVPPRRLLGRRPRRVRDGAPAHRVRRGGGRPRALRHLGAGLPEADPGDGPAADPAGA